MTLEEYILQQVHYLASPRSDLPHSVLAFGVTESQTTSLFAKAKALFDKIKAVNNKRRSNELSTLIDWHAGPMLDKYRNLMERYSDNPRQLQEIYQWESEAFQTEYKYIKNLPTPLRERTDEFELLDFDVREFYKVRKRHRELGDQADLEGLQRADHDPEFARYYRKRDIEIEYEETWDYIRDRLFPGYAFVHNISEPLDDGYSLEYLFKPFYEGQVNWSVICFEPNHDFWASQSSDNLKELLYPDRIIFDEAVNITPIENRLKEALDKKGLHYSFQHPVDPYLLDFYFDLNGVQLDVECDGKEFHSTKFSIEHDLVRDNAMATKGILVLRFTGSQIWRDAERCVDIIQNALKPRKP
jgi:very-short-patch-repair endonuclease